MKRAVLSSFIHRPSILRPTTAMLGIRAATFGFNGLRQFSTGDSYTQPMSPFVGSVQLTDEISSEIINQEHTIDSLLEIYYRNENKLSNVHRVLLFNKVTLLFVKQIDELK